MCSGTFKEDNRKGKKINIWGEIFGGETMKIDGMKSHQGFVKGFDINQNIAQRQLKNEMFNQMMKESLEGMKTGNPEEERIHIMIDSIDKLKRTLEMDLTVENLNSFKEAVKSFLEYYTNHKMSLEDFYLMDEKGYQKKMRIIRAVDEKVNNLTEHMLETNQGHLELLKSVGEIHGLVINELW